MYIIQNPITEQLEICTNLLTVSKITSIKYNTLTNCFSRKKQKNLKFEHWTIHKKEPITSNTNLNQSNINNQ